jgi:hypothetical protein
VLSSVSRADIVKQLRDDLRRGEAPSKAIRSLEYLPWPFLAHCILEAYCVRHTDFTQVLFAWGPFQSHADQAIDDTVFDRWALNLIQEKRHLWDNATSPANVPTPSGHHASANPAYSDTTRVVIRMQRRNGRITYHLT